MEPSERNTPPQTNGHRVTHKLYCINQRKPEPVPRRSTSLSSRPSTPSQAPQETHRANVDVPRVTRQSPCQYNSIMSKSKSDQKAKVKTIFPDLKHYRTKGQRNHRTLLLGPLLWWPVPVKTLTLSAPLADNALISVSKTSTASDTCKP